MQLDAVHWRSQGRTRGEVALPSSACLLLMDVLATVLMLSTEGWNVERSE